VEHLSDGEQDEEDYDREDSQDNETTASSPISKNEDSGAENDRCGWTESTVVLADGIAAPTPSLIHIKPPRIQGKSSNSLHCPIATGSYFKDRKVREWAVSSN
jgi:hypothetical protein